MTWNLLRLVETAIVMMCFCIRNVVSHRNTRTKLNNKHNIHNIPSSSPFYLFVRFPSIIAIVVVVVIASIILTSSMLNEPIERDVNVRVAFGRNGITTNLRTTKGKLFVFSS